jgi:hypothetical protein
VPLRHEPGLGFARADWECGHVRLAAPPGYCLSGARTASRQSSSLR